MVYDDPFLGEWLEEESDDEPKSLAWRRLVVPVVAAITVVALALVPLYNLISAQPPLARNGLEVCGFDYCIVQEAVRNAGLDLTMARLSNTILADEEAAGLAAALASRLGIERVDLMVVDRLDGQIKGQYDPVTRTIFVERPATAWIVVHEIAHTSAQGHGEAFLETLTDLLRSLAGSETA